MNGVQELFDYETALEDGFAVAMLDAGLTVYTPRFAVKFQKERPRVEFEFVTGQAKKSYGPVNTDGDFSRLNASWFGELRVHIITASGDSTGQDSSIVHRVYRSTVRYQMMGKRPVAIAAPFDGINGLRPANLEPITLGSGTTARIIAGGDQYLLFHKVQNIIETGTTPQYSPDKGFEQSSIIYGVEFGIDGAAWSEIANNP